MLTGGYMSLYKLFYKNLLILGIAVISFPVFSQEIEEVVVTATKKAESLQDVAIAVDAISSEEIEAQQIRDMYDIAEAIPGLAVGKSIGVGSAYTIRGIGSFGVGAATLPSVITAVNGHSVNDSTFALMGFFDLESIEVAKGPQGTLNGRNATTGVINVITARPTDEFGGSVDLEFGDWNHKMMSHVVNIPVSDKVRTRLAIRTNDRDGFIENLYLRGSDGSSSYYNDRNEMMGRFSMDADLTDNTELKFTYTRFENDDARSSEMINFCDQDSFFGCSPFALGQAHNAGDTRGHYSGGLNLFAHFYNVFATGGIANTFETDFEKYPQLVSDPYRYGLKNRNPENEAAYEVSSIEINHQLTDSIMMIAKYSYETRDYFHVQDQDGSVSSLPIGGLAKALNPLAPNIATNLCYQHFCEFTSGDAVYESSTVASNDQQVEINFISDFDGAFNFTTGVYMYDSRNDNRYMVETPAGHLLADFSVHPYNFLFQTLGLPDLGAYGGVNFNRQLSACAATGFQPACIGNIIATNTPYHTPSEISGILQHDHVRTKNFAVFGEAYFDLSEVTKLTLGLRYNDDSVANSSIACLTDLNCRDWLTNGGIENGGVYNSENPSQVSTITPAYGVQRYDNISYKVALQHDISDDIMVYASVTTSAKPGGFNPGISADVPLTYDEEESETYELGFRSILAGGAVRLNMNLYQDNRIGLQAGAIKDTSAINFNIDGEINGFEGQMLAYLSETTRIDFSWLVTDAEVTKGVVIDPLNPTGATAIAQRIGHVTLGGLAPFGLLTAAAMDNGTVLYKSFGAICASLGAPILGLPCSNPGTPQDVTGNKLPAQADLAYNIALVQDFPHEQGTTTVRVSLSHTGERFGDVWNNARSKIPEIDLINLRVNYVDNDDWYLGFYGKNLEDKVQINYLRNNSNFGGGSVYGSVNDPRTYGIAFGSKF